MEKVKLSEVLEYLRDGELYKAMLDNSEDPNEMLTFDTSVLKKNTKVESTRDCDHLLNSLKFWGVNKFYGEIAEFVLNSPSAKIDAILAKYEEQFAYARALRHIKKDYGRKKRVKGQLCDAIEAGCVELVQYLSRGKSMLPQLDACLLAARGGSADMLKLVHQRGYALHGLVARKAVQMGRMDCLIYAHERGVSFAYDLLWDAAKFGHLDCLQYLFQSGCRWHSQVASMLLQVVICRACSLLARMVVPGLAIRATRLRKEGTSIVYNIHMKTAVLGAVQLVM